MMAKIIRCATMLMCALGITSLIKGIASEDLLQVLVDGSAVINCFPNKAISLQWHHTPPGKSRGEVAYAIGTFYDSYNTGRLRVNSNSTANIYTLFITNATYEDAGLYQCREDQTTDVFGSTQIIIINSSLICNSNMHPGGFIGPNKCDLQMENMTFSCALSFAGIPPSLMLGSFNGSQHQLIDSVCTNQSNHIDCSFTLKADPEYDGSVFNCETKASQGVRLNCSTDVIKVQYFSAGFENSTRRVYDNVSCIVRSNLETRYNWTIEKSGQYVFLSSRRTIVMQKPGLYRCDVEYSIRNNTCSFLTSVVNASVDSTNEEVVTGSSAGSQKEQGNVLAIAISLSIVLSIVLVAVLVAFVVYAKCFKGKLRFGLRPGDDPGLPLIDFKRKRLDRIRPRLTEICSIPHIRTELIRKQKILQVINEGADDADAADGVDVIIFERLLSAISERMHDEDFLDPFKEALAEINPTLGKYFEKGEIVAVDVTTERPELDGRLSEAFNEAVINRPDLFLELGTFSICMVVAKPSNSIEVLIYCGESENMRRFIDIFNSGELDKLLDRVLENLLWDDSSSNAGSLEAKVCIRQKEARLVGQFAEQSDWLQDKSKIRKSSSTSTPGNESVSRRESLSKSDSNVQLTDRPASVVYMNMTPQKKDKKENVTDITESNWREILQSNYADLLVKIDSNSEGGLKGEFKKLGLFTPGQINNIWGYRSSIDRNKAILSLLEKGDLERFLTVRSALEKSGQRPIVKQHLSLIKEHLSAPNDKYKEPLKGSYRYQMLVNWNKLLDNIGDVEGLIFLITERGTLTDYQKAVLEDLSHRPSKLNYLLRLLETGSQQHFDDFCDCLKQNNQGHIVNDYLTPKSINKNLDDIPKSFKDMKLCFSVKTRPIRGRVLVISNRRYLDQNRSEMHGNETNLNIFFDEKLIFQKKPIFDGKLMTNETVQGIRKTPETEQLSSKDYDLFLMFLFSYGNSREIFTAGGESLKIDDLFEMFDDKNCPKLGGKPKLFIIQTFERDDERDDSPSLDAKGKLSVKFKLKDDMAVVYTTVKGEPENGREETGTLFTRCLLEVFFDKIEANFEEIIKKVLELLREREQKITLANGKVQTVQQLTTFQTKLKQEVFLVEQR